MIPPRRSLKDLLVPRDATETARQGQGIGDLEAIKQMATTAIPEVLRAAPATSTPMGLFDLAQAVRNRDAAGAGMAALGMVPFAGAMRYADDAVNAARGLPVVEKASEAVRRLFHGSPVADLKSFDRLAPRELTSKPDRMDSFGTWFAESPEDAKMFTRGFDAEGKPMVGKIYETDVTLSNPKEYNSFDELLDDFNRASGREEWVGRTRRPEGSPPSSRGIAPGGGNKFNEYLRNLGYDGAKVTEAAGIDRPGSPQTYWVSLDPDRQSKIRRLFSPEP